MIETIKLDDDFGFEKRYQLSNKKSKSAFIKEIFFERDKFEVLSLEQATLLRDYKKKIEELKKNLGDVK
jgi:hypothetical protein